MISKDDPRFVAVEAFIMFATGVIGARLLWGVTMSEPPITSVADMLFGGALFWLIYYLTQKTDAQR